MDINQLEALLVEAYRHQHWSAGLRVMDTHLGDPDSLIRGGARVYKASLVYRAAASMAPKALELLHQARTLIAGHPRLQMWASIEGMLYSQYMGDMTAWESWKVYGKKILETGSPDAVCWRGRHRYMCAHYWLRMGELALEKAQSAAKAGRVADADASWAEATEHLEKALVQSEQAASWYERNVGPWGQAEGGCQVRFARFLGADVLWVMGKHTEAVEAVQPLIAEVVGLAEHESERLLWEGRTASMHGDYAGAANLLTRAWEANRSHRHRDHHLTLRIAEALIATLAAAGRRDEMDRWADMVLEEASSVENVGLVYRLQRLLADVTVGRHVYETEADPACDPGRRVGDNPVC